MQRLIVALCLSAAAALVPNSAAARSNSNAKAPLKVVSGVPKRVYGSSALKEERCTTPSQHWLHASSFVQKDESIRPSRAIGAATRKTPTTKTHPTRDVVVVRRQQLRSATPSHLVAKTRRQKSTAIRPPRPRRRRDQKNTRHKTIQKRRPPRWNASRRRRPSSPTSAPRRA